jgi:hypothetical protein
MYYPLIFEKSTVTIPAAANANNLTCTVPILVEYGKPQFVFIYAERELPDSVAYRPQHYPTIVGVDIRFAYSNIHLAKYLNDELELWKVVRKNINKGNYIKNLKKYDGAILLNTNDIGFWGMNHMEKNEMFELNFNVIVKPSPTVVEEAHPDVRYASPMKVTVALIYEDRMFISGTADRIAFQKIK